VATQEVILFAKLKPGLQPTRVPGAHRAMVVTHFFGERSRPPSFHSRRRNCTPIDPTATDGNVTSNFVKTFVSEQLASPGNVLNVRKAIVIGAIPFDKRRPGNTQIGIMCKFGEQELKIRRLESYVCVQVPDDVVVHPL
jgi:hypothetical protein